MQESEENSESETEEENSKSPSPVKASSVTHVTQPRDTTAKTINSASEKPNTQSHNNSKIKSKTCSIL